jgi:hypothetical protein
MARVKSLLINIFGGIEGCGRVAAGLNMTCGPAIAAGDECASPVWLQCGV